MNKAAGLVRRGAERHAAGDAAGAEGLYRRALDLDPGCADAWNLLGVLDRARGEAGRAVERTGRALALSPEAPVFLASHGAALAEAGRPEEAAPLLARAVALRPEDAVSRRNLGQALAALGRAAEALPHLRRAAGLVPGDAETLLALAHAAREAGEREEARRAARSALSASGGGDLAEAARFLLAALGEGEAPDRAPASYVRDLFDAYAPRFEEELTGRLEYRTPAALADLLARAGVRPEGRLDALDLGCGTGLSGAALRPFAARLVGVDLSPRMLAEAARGGAYDDLAKGELVEVLGRSPAAWDLIAAADVLNYLGDLGPALSGLASALRPGGLAALSLETGRVAPYELGEGLRYRHNPDHALALAEARGLRVLAREGAVLRRERGAPVEGTLAVLVRDQGIFKPSGIARRLGRCDETIS